MRLKILKDKYFFNMNKRINLIAKWKQRRKSWLLDWLTYCDILLQAVNPVIRVGGLGSARPATPPSCSRTIHPLNRYVTRSAFVHEKSTFNLTS